MTAIGLAVHRRGIGLGPVRLFHIVFCEVVAAAVLVSWSFPVPTPYIVSAVGALCVVGMVMMSTGGRGRRLTVALRSRHLRRQPEESEEKIGALDALAPGIRIAGVSERHVECGVAYDGNGWFSGIALHHADPTEPSSLDVGTLALLMETLRDPHTSASSVQLVNQLIPSPSVEVDPDSSCARSYAELLGEDVAVGHQMTWLAVRLDIPTAAKATDGRGGGSLGARRTVSSMTTRLSKRLTDLGIAHRILGPDSLRFALTASISGESVSAAMPRGAGERWDQWKLGTLTQVSFDIDGNVRDINDVRSLWMSISALSASFVIISTTIYSRSNSDDVGIFPVIRVAYDVELESNALEELEKAAKDNGLQLRRCDGEQAAATYASSVTGGATPR
ncbi:MAG TPA: type VII secretion protein EccE [Candidatus Stackebrandtia faecavium]|nr:type VII secretion protein EccE [Candidatus Stackebrandtia faecavium]